MGDEGKAGAGVAPRERAAGEAFPGGGPGRRACLGELFAVMGEAFGELGVGMFRVELANEFVGGERPGRRLKVAVGDCPDCPAPPESPEGNCLFGEVIRGMLDGFAAGGFVLQELRHQSAGPRACRFEAGVF
jgi:predicted hydrocarbon binding protein